MNFRPRIVQDDSEPIVRPSAPDPVEAMADDLPIPDALRMLVRRLARRAALEDLAAIEAAQPKP